MALRHREATPASTPIRSSYAGHPPRRRLRDLTPATMPPVSGVHAHTPRRRPSDSASYPPPIHRLWTTMGHLPQASWDDQESRSADTLPPQATSKEPKPPDITDQHPDTREIPGPPGSPEPRRVPPRSSPANPAEPQRHAFTSGEAQIPTHPSGLRRTEPPQHHARSHSRPLSWTSTRPCASREPGDRLAVRSGPGERPPVQREDVVQRLTRRRRERVVGQHVRGLVRDPVAG